MNSLITFYHLSPILIVFLFILNSSNISVLKPTSIMHDLSSKEGAFQPEESIFPCDIKSFNFKLYSIKIFEKKYKFWLIPELVLLAESSPEVTYYCKEVTRDSLSHDYFVSKTNICSGNCKNEEKVILSVSKSKNNNSLEVKLKVFQIFTYIGPKKSVLLVQVFNKKSVKVQEFEASSMFTRSFTSDTTFIQNLAVIK